jgi:hypothetical protein
MEVLMAIKDCFVMLDFVRRSLTYGPHPDAQACRFSTFLESALFSGERD